MSIFQLESSCQFHSQRLSSSPELENDFWLADSKETSSMLEPQGTEPDQ